MAKFNGHKNWNHWNVSLWINNDEGLYRLALHLVKHCGSCDVAAKQLMKEFRVIGTTRTPDGAPYSVSSIRAAMRGL